MTRTCGTCGAPAPVDEAVFCNRCGARLPPPAMTCPACAREVSDPLSRFCDRCGLPLTGPEEPLPQEPEVSEPEEAPAPVPALARRPRGEACPACGFENDEKNRYYCRRCGAYIKTRGPVSDAAGGVGAPRIMKGDIRIKPDGMDAIRQRPVFAPEPPENQPVRKKRSPKPGGGRSLPWKKIAIGAAALIIIIVAAMVLPGMLKGENGNATAAKTLAAAEPEAGAGDAEPGSSPLDSLFGAIQGLIPGGGLFSNQGTPVVTDTEPVP